MIRKHATLRYSALDLHVTTNSISAVRTSRYKEYRPQLARIHWPAMSRVGEGMAEYEPDLCRLVSVYDIIVKACTVHTLSVGHDTKLPIHVTV